MLPGARLEVNIWRDIKYLTRMLLKKTLKKKTALLLSELTVWNECTNGTKPGLSLFTPPPPPSLPPPDPLQEREKKAEKHGPWAIYGLHAINNPLAVPFPYIYIFFYTKNRE